VGFSSIYKATVWVPTELTLLISVDSSNLPRYESSLYHYLVDHPRVLPASEKQIHYFKYFSKRPLQWYYNHFPTATSFLANGALMTGEASPGYLPYPDVVDVLRQKMPGPRLVAIGRNPLERAYSSYRYNYAHPTISEMQKGEFSHILPGKPDEYYLKYLFSYEDMIRAELKVVRECISPKGRGVVGAREKWGDLVWAKEEFRRRKTSGLPPLVDLDGFCYGDEVNATVVRKQWAELVSKYPEKVITKKDVHVSGESLLVFAFLLESHSYRILFLPNACCADCS